jgi:hypothetical protein
MNAIQFDGTTAESSASPLIPPSGQRQELVKEARDESAEWNKSPAELYGCLCHRPERITGQ